MRTVTLKMPEFFCVFFSNKRRLINPHPPPPTHPRHFPLLKRPLLESRPSDISQGLSPSSAARAGDTCLLEQNPCRTWRWWYVCLCVYVCVWVGVCVCVWVGVCVCVCVCVREGGRKRKKGEQPPPPHHHHTSVHVHVQTPRTSISIYYSTCLGAKLYETENFPTNKLDCSQLRDQKNHQGEKTAFAITPMCLYCWSKCRKYLSLNPSPTCFLDFPKHFLCIVPTEPLTNQISCLSWAWDKSTCCRACSVQTVQNTCKWVKQAGCRSE